MRPLLDSGRRVCPMSYSTLRSGNVSQGEVRRPNYFRISKCQTFEIPGFAQVKCDAPGFKDVKRRNLRSFPILPLTDSRFPFPRLYFTCILRDCAPWKLGGRELFPKCQNSEISHSRNFGFAKVKEVGRRNLRPTDISHLGDSRAPFPEGIFYKSKQKPTTGEVEMQKLFPKFRNARYSKFRIAECKFDTWF